MGLPEPQPKRSWARRVLRTRRPGAHALLAISVPIFLWKITLAMDTVSHSAKGTALDPAKLIRRALELSPGDDDTRWGVVGADSS